MNSTIEEDGIDSLLAVNGITADEVEGSADLVPNEDLWTNVTGDENGIYLSGSVTLFIK